MRSFVVTVQMADAELAADRLWQIGVSAVEERVGDEGQVELWTVVGDEDAAVERAAAMLDARWPWRTEDGDDERSESWRDHARPMAVGDRLVVVPAWWGQIDVATGDRIPVLIEPGAAFGLGDHPTTALSLGALEREMRRDPPPSVLDVGCGTGVLSIAAALLGTRLTRAVDISAAAVESTLQNTARNGVTDMIEVDTTPIADLDGAYDIVLANILAPDLISMADDLCRLTAPGGRLIVSGILADAHEHVLEALRPMRVCRTDTSGGWAAVVLSHS
jgi:ribosomal protein L11 methyltransferase